MIKPHVQSILFFFFCFLANTILAQNFTAYFEDRTKLDYQVLKNHTDQMSKVNLQLFAKTNYIYRSYFSVSYFQPRWFMVKVDAGTDILGGDVLFFLKSFENKAIINQTLKSTYITSHAVLKKKTAIEVTRKTYIGLHLGHNFIGKGERINELVGGIGLTRGKYTKVYLITSNPKVLLGSYQNSLYMDVLYYPKRNLHVMNEKYLIYRDVQASYRFYIEGKAAFWGTLDFGVVYQLGAQMIGDDIKGLLGFGLFFGLY